MGLHFNIYFLNVVLDIPYVKETTHHQTTHAQHIRQILVDALLLGFVSWVNGSLSCVPLLGEVLWFWM